MPLMMSIGAFCAIARTAATPATSVYSTPATTSGKVPLSVGVLEAKLTDFADAASAGLPNVISNVNTSGTNFSPITYAGCEESPPPFPSPVEGEDEYGSGRRRNAAEML